MMESLAGFPDSFRLALMASIRRYSLAAAANDLAEMSAANREESALRYQIADWGEENEKPEYGKWCRDLAAKLELYASERDAVMGVKAV